MQIAPGAAHTRPVSLIARKTTIALLVELHIIVGCSPSSLGLQEVALSLSLSLSLSVCM